jgi:hypothetical protein
MKNRIPKSAITEKQLRRLLRDEAEDTSLSAWAVDNGITPQAVSAFMRKCKRRGCKYPRLWVIILRRFTCRGRRSRSALSGLTTIAETQEEIETIMPLLFYGRLNDGKRRLYSPDLRPIESSVFDNYMVKHLAPYHQRSDLANLWWFEDRNHTAVSWNECRIDITQHRGIIANETRDFK